MKCKVLRANEDGDLELATLIVKTNKEVIATIEISWEMFDKLINCDKKTRNDTIFNILWNGNSKRID